MRAYKDTIHSKGYILTQSMLHFKFHKWSMTTLRTVAIRSLVSATYFSSHYDVYGYLSAMITYWH